MVAGMNSAVEVPLDSEPADAETPPSSERDSPSRPGWWAMLRRRPSLGGIALAVLFWWKSLTPSLMPRTAVAQGMVSAVCIGFAIMVGTFIGWVVHRTMARFHWNLRNDIRRGLWIAISVAGALVFVTGLVVWADWQNDQRDLFGMEHISSSSLVPMVLATIVLTIVVVSLGRIVWRGVRAIDRWLSRHFRRTGATIATVIVVVVLFNWTSGFLFSTFDDWARTTFGSVDDGTDPGATQPTEATVSGSSESLIAWETLGRQGRNFVAEATSESDLKAFHGDDAAVVRPVRVYAGLESADDAEARAELAVRDLERAGGFDRAVLVVTTVTGTGWVDPDAATAVEQLWQGDTAMVAIQYSFLPSWISTLVDADVAQEAGSELFNAVYAAWKQLPENDRPKLVVFGQSLGSLGGEAAFLGHDARTSVANMVNRTEGVLYTGPTNSNGIWRQLVAARDEGSTAWLPIYRDGESVRFANQNVELLRPFDDWKGTRVLYIQHPSDPVTFWNMETMWSEPEWIQDPKGYDISGRTSWFPFVTWAQGVADLAAGFGAEPGFGHDYSISFVPGWAAVAPPDGWTPEDSQLLMAFLGRG
jgi:uncharacterized membrane protein